MATPKQIAQSLIEHLPDEVSWDDLMHELMVRREIERGLEDDSAGRVLTVDEVRKHQ